jgi:hypothetical protein
MAGMTPDKRYSDRARPPRPLYWRTKEFQLKTPQTEQWSGDDHTFAKTV